MRGVVDCLRTAFLGFSIVDRVMGVIVPSRPVIVNPEQSPKSVETRTEGTAPPGATQLGQAARTPPGPLAESAGTIPITILRHPWRHGSRGCKAARYRDTVWMVERIPLRRPASSKPRRAVLHIPCAGGLTSTVSPVDWSSRPTPWPVARSIRTAENAEIAVCCQKRASDQIGVCFVLTGCMLL